MIHREVHYRRRCHLRTISFDGLLNEQFEAKPTTQKSARYCTRCSATLTDYRRGHTLCVKTRRIQLAKECAPIRSKAGIFVKGIGCTKIDESTATIDAVLVNSDKKTVTWRWKYPPRTKKGGRQIRTRATTETNGVQDDPVDINSEHESRGASC